MLPCQNARSSFHQQRFWLAPPRTGCLLLHGAGSAGISQSPAGLPQPLCMHGTGIAPLLCSHPGIRPVLVVCFKKDEIWVKYHCPGLQRNPSA